ncbi:MAG: hypothetical protein V8S58_09605, partial [Lachnospiraceae bacterium]
TPWCFFSSGVVLPKLKGSGQIMALSRFSVFAGVSSAAGSSLFFMFDEHIAHAFKAPGKNGSFLDRDGKYPHAVQSYWFLHICQILLLSFHCSSFHSFCRVQVLTNSYPSAVYRAYTK